MARNDAMRDPFYAPILFKIEGVLHNTDRLVKAEGITLTDSAVRSLLVRAINEARGKTAKKLPSSARDRALTEAQRALSALRLSLSIVEGEEGPEPEGVALPAADWIYALKAIKESCEVRTGGEPGSRGYLDYLESFLRDAMRRAEERN